MPSADGFADIILAHIADVGAGRCRITDDLIASEPDANKQQILAGLLMLHEDLEHASLLRATVESERERLVEEQSRLVTQLEAAVQLRDDFLRIASHELRTPLTTLALRVGQLMAFVERRAHPLPDGAPLKAGLTALDRQVRRLSQLVDEMLDVKRIVGGRLTAIPEDLDLVDVTNTLIACFAETMRGSPEISLHASAPARGRWDPFLLERIVSSLLSNAVRFGRGRPITVAIETSSDKVRLKVCDEGLGIRPDAQHRIFKPFERAVSSKNYGGFGLGLWIAERCAEEMGGRILVESVPEVGSTFIVELPRADQMASK